MPSSLLGLWTVLRKRFAVTDPIGMGAVLMRIEKLSAVLFAVIALMFSYSAFAEEEETKHPCHEPVDPECEVTPVTGENPDEDYDQYNECMRYLNDDRMCSGGAVGVNETVRPTAFEQEAPMVNYEESYQHAAFGGCGHFSEAARNAPAATADSAWDLYNACIAVEAMCAAWKIAEGTDGEALFRAGGAASAAAMCSLLRTGPMGARICGTLGREYTDEAMRAVCNM